MSVAQAFWRPRIWLAMLTGITDVTRILSQVEQGDPQAAEQLLPLVYELLRKLAAAHLAQERPGRGERTYFHRQGVRS